MNKYECTTNQELANMAAYSRADGAWELTRWQHCLRKMTSLPPSWKCGVKSKIRLCQSILTPL